MKLSSVAHLFRRSLRSLWENLYLNSVAAGVIAAALLLLGVYLTVQYNLNTIVDTWESDVHVSAYFHPDISEERRFITRDELAARPEVSKVRYVSSTDAQAWLASRIDGIDVVLDELGTDTLPASLEITLDATTTQPTAVMGFVKSIDKPEFVDIDYGQEWVERFNTFLSLIKLLGAILGSLILVAGLFLVANTIHLVVYNRKDELEIQKLVGGTTTFIITPFLLEGMVQGAVGAGFATAGLWAVHHLLVQRLQNALELSLAGELHFLPMEYLLGLMGAGMLLGLCAAYAAVRRFLSKAP